MEKIYLTAKQARELMLKYETPKNRIYKIIKDVAQEDGCNGWCYWFDEYIDSEVKQKLINDLKANGYEVQTVIDSETGKELNAIEIRW